MGGCCCSFPRNPRFQSIARWILLGLTILSWIFSVVTIGTCSFVSLPGYSDSKGLGLFSLDLNGNCVRYSNIETFQDHDGGRTAAQAFGTLACIALLAALIGVSSSIVLLPTHIAQVVWWLTRMLYVCAELCVLLTFSFYGSFVVSYICDDPDFCVLGSGGTATALNVWVLAVILVLCFGVPEPDQPILSVWDVIEDVGDDESQQQHGPRGDTDTNKPRGRRLDEDISETYIHRHDESSAAQFDPSSSEDNADSLFCRKSDSIPFQESIDFPSSSEDERRRSSSSRP